MGKQRKKKTRRDTAEIARDIVEQVIGEKLSGEPLDEPEPDTRNPAAVELGRLGGLKGGKARAVKLTAEQRSDIAKKAATTRWKKED
ncbi:MAG: hypothetical protein JXQ75_23710 [Phycisphaerae bacterium]|nr:hypothetical protein [Phycisphaerae bacterium]